MKERRLPERWKEINLKDYIIALESGKRPKGGAVDNGVPSLGGEHINGWGGFNIEPNKFADIVCRVEAFKVKNNKSQIQLENLFNSLMQKAFREELEFN
ncbi:hypothetical protein [Clostridium sp. BJN0013]|uniref:hypothetical protein n=1 Tax=Clostridium sp. BJN0013 TaxID=3236840 RepID=UPI0034C5CD21